MKHNKKLKNVVEAFTTTQIRTKNVWKQMDNFELQMQPK